MPEPADHKEFLSFNSMVSFFLVFFHCSLSLRNVFSKSSTRITQVQYHCKNSLMPFNNSQDNRLMIKYVFYLRFTISMVMYSFCLTFHSNFSLPSNSRLCRPAGQTNRKNDSLLLIRSNSWSSLDNKYSQRFLLALPMEKETSISWNCISEK